METARLRSSSSSPTLHTEEVSRVLGELRRLGQVEDRPAKERVLRRERDLGRRVWGAERPETGLDDLVELRAGDALTTLRDVPGRPAVPRRLERYVTVEIPLGAGVVVVSALLGEDD